jgi:phage shock protein PspC (stress-responsive transcriptional regulator)
MSFVDELARLEQLRASGALSDEEFQRAKARLLDTPPPPDPAAAINRLRRSRDDRWIGGVCGGIAQATGIESWIWRLLFSVLLIFGGTGLVIYLLLWIFVPQD